MVGDVRGLGLMIGIEMVRRPGNQGAGARSARPHRRHGLRTRPADPGRGQNTIRLCPPLVITRDQAISPSSTLEECLQGQLD